MSHESGAAMVSESVSMQEFTAQKVGTTVFELLARPYDVSTVVAVEEKSVPTFQPTQYTTRENGKLIGIDFDSEPDR